MSDIEVAFNPHLHWRVESEYIIMWRVRQYFLVPVLEAVERLTIVVDAVLLEAGKGLVY